MVLVVVVVKVEATSIVLVLADMSKVLIDRCVAADPDKRDDLDRVEEVMDVASRRRSMAATINSRQAMMKEAT